MIKNLEKLRNRVFWILDKIIGSPVASALHQIEIFDNMDSNNVSLLEYHQRSLFNIIEHAKNTTEYYKNINSYDIFDFPIIDKNIIRENQTAFLSNIYRTNSLVKISTSGSTGTPFVCYQDAMKKKRVQAEIIYYSNKVGYEVGKKLIFLRSLNRSNSKSKIIQWIQNEDLIDVSSLSDKNIEKLLVDIKEKATSDSVLLSYASTLDTLRDYFEKNGYNNRAQLSGIISGAEMLYDDTRISMENAFQCKCISRYSNQENGVIGQDYDEFNSFIINEANYFVEVFKFEKNEPVGIGEVGRIIVTDLYNKAMPMIRYDTGDIGAIEYMIYNGKTKKVISNFGGRKMDMVFDCYENAVSPHKISVAFWQFPALKQYQFIQKSKKEYLIKVNPSISEKDTNILREILFSLLGDAASIIIEPVDEIPTLSSGKRRYIVNEYIKNERE